MKVTKKITIKHHGREMEIAARNEQEQAWANMGLTIIGAPASHRKRKPVDEVYILYWFLEFDDSSINEYVNTSGWLNLLVGGHNVSTNINDPAKPFREWVAEADDWIETDWTRQMDRAWEADHK